jgi:uncharacterized protein (DUF305 family)
MSCQKLNADKISDKEFLELMIKHHNVAIKMSRKIMETSNDDYILDFARRTIYEQELEVTLMEKLLKSIPNIQLEKSEVCYNSLISAQIEKLYPGILANAKCEDSHFEGFANIPLQMRSDNIYEDFQSLEERTEDFAQIDETKIMTDQEYIDHMIAHHKSGVDLSKIVIASTNEPKIYNLAQNIVLSQEKDAFKLATLNNMCKNNWRNRL